jgi:predicted Holliday junction resolvase-like endonuclease
MLQLNSCIQEKECVMSVWLAMLIGGCIGVVITTIILSSTRNGRVQAEYEKYIAELELEHKQALLDAQKRSVNTSRAVLKGKMAEQFAPILPEFQYLPSDAKFLGDPVDYVVFDGYTDFRDGDGTAEDIEVILLDIKSGGARLSKGQQAIAQAVREGRIRFETLRIDFED